MGRCRFIWRYKSSETWWRTSVENRKYGVPRIAQLRSARVAVRFLSVEPLLEDLGKLNLKKIHWMIFGGELSRRKADGL
ncbi:MAG: DUF5131 family protein [Edaphobacter sp.]